MNISHTGRARAIVETIEHKLKSKGTGELIQRRIRESRSRSLEASACDYFHRFGAIEHCISANGGSQMISAWAKYEK
jgi:hypothetical protein